MESILAILDERPKAYLICADNIKRSRLSLDPGICKYIEDGCFIIDIVESANVFIGKPVFEDWAFWDAMTSVRFVQLP
jgi:hypothetical protein